MQAIAFAPVSAPLGTRQTRTRAANVTRVAPLRCELQVAKRPLKAPELAAEGDSIQSTPGQQAAVAGFGVVAALESVNIAVQASGPEEAAASIAAAMLGYLFADFGVGVYHWGVDNYGSENTPIFGFQIAAFQGHHSFPWTISHRQFANNLYRLTQPTTPQMLALLALPIPPAFASFYASSLIFIVLSQEMHRQAHMTRSGPFISALQNAGLSVSKKAHGQHHSSSFEGS